MYFPKVSLIFHIIKNPTNFGDSAGYEEPLGTLFFSQKRFNQLTMVRGFRGAGSQAIEGEAFNNHEATSPQQI